MFEERSETGYSPDPSDRCVDVCGGLKGLRQDTHLILVTGVLMFEERSEDPSDRCVDV